jgi:hypothetical protein
MVTRHSRDIIQRHPHLVETGEEVCPSGRPFFRDRMNMVLPFLLEHFSFHPVCLSYAFHSDIALQPIEMKQGVDSIG